jgi:cytidine deaminase
MEVKKYSSKEALSTADKVLLEEAIKSREQAYAPYSRFKVGAALLLEDGTIVKGNNQENAAYPSGLCAERVAIFAASANHPQKKMLAMAVTCRHSEKPTLTPFASCGACRQVMLEYELVQENPIRTLFYGEDGEVWEVASTKLLLPFFFDKTVLE